MMKLLPVAIVVLFLIMSSTSAAQIEQAENTAETVVVPAPNPHWRLDGCAACHGLGEPKILPLEQVDLVCLKCHDGLRAHRERHPIGRSFASNQVRRPESWPTQGELLSCITCHDVLRGCHESAHRPGVNPLMLRGKGMNNLSFCGECHVAEKHQRFNPHAVVQDAEADAKSSCVICHNQEMPAGPQAERTGVPSLNNSEITLCGQCHRQHLDFFSPGHIGITVTASILENMRKGDARPTDGRSNPMVLPLSAGKVVCSTCHNPHQAGVFDGSSLLGRNAMGFVDGLAEDFALRVRGGQLCIHCHGSINPGPR